MSNSALNERLHRWLAGNAEDHVLRWLLRVLLIATVSVLALDLSAMTGSDQAWRETLEQPVLPDIAPTTTEVPSPAAARSRPLRARVGACWR